MSRLAIDPVTRLGHLRIEAEIVDGVVSDAWSAGTMFRGIESIMTGRDPRDAWLIAQRICGRCTTAHALASVRAVEQAVGATPPRNARLARNLMAGTQLVLDHVIGFYQRQAPDWVDLAAGVRANPAATAALAHRVSDWPESDATHFGAIRDRLAVVVGSDRPGLFANGPWGHPAFRLPPEADLLLMSHQLAALDWHRRVSRVHSILGGKNPHPQTFIVGGMALAAPWGGPEPSLPGEHPRQVDRNAPAALSREGLKEVGDLLRAARVFVEQVYLPDVLLLAEHYPEWGTLGRGIGNYLAFGDLPEADGDEPHLLFPRGRIMARSLARTHAVEQSDVAETVASSHYDYEGDDEALRHPYDGQTRPSYGGPPLPYDSLAEAAKYSWLKAPRLGGTPMEVGPLARILVASVEGRDAARHGVEEAAARLEGGPDALFSTLGRVVARAVEARLVAERLESWHGELVASLASGDLSFADLSAWDPAAWPDEARGLSLGEAPGGALGHWVVVRGGQVVAYQVVDASTWNASPRDGQGRRGACEEALVGTPVADPARPVEILRTVHSFDPCPACAVHAVDSHGGGRCELRVTGETRR